MDAVRPLILPATARLVSGDEGLIVVHDGDVVLEQTLGLPLAQVTADGDLQVLIRATGSLMAGGTVQIMDDADVERIEGQEVHLGPHTIQARVVVAHEQVVVSPGARLNIEILSAPRVVLAPGIKGRIRLLDTLEPVPPTALRGCHDIEGYEETFGGVVAFFEEMGVEPVRVRTGQAVSMPSPRSTAPSVGQRTDPEPPSMPPPSAPASPPPLPEGLRATASPSAPPPSYPTFSSRSSHPPGPGLANGPAVDGATAGFARDVVPSGRPVSAPAHVDEDIDDDETVDDDDTVSIEVEAIEEDLPDETSLETLATDAFEDIDEADYEEVESIESVAFEVVPEPAPAPRKRPPRTRAKHHAQVRKAWDRIALAYGNELPQGLHMMREAIDANRTADVIRQLDAYWATTLRAHLASHTPPPREVIRAFLALHGLR